MLRPGTIDFIGNLPPGSPGIKKAYFETDWNTDFSNLRVRSILTGGDHKFPFTIPPDFSVLVSAYIESLPLATFTDEDIDLVSEYAGQGENFQTHAETDTASLHSGVAQQWGKLDISSVLSAIAAGDIGGVKVDHNIIGTIVYYGRLVLEYI